MTPTLAQREYVAIVRTPGETPDYGDVVYFELSDQSGTTYVKRVVALPGDHVQMREGRVILNGQALPRLAKGAPFGLHTYEERTFAGKAYTIVKEGDHGPFDDTSEFVVPPGALFVLGDNRDNSLDSRMPAPVGFVPISHVVGHGGVIFLTGRRDRFLATVR